MYDVKEWKIVSKLYGEADIVKQFKWTSLDGLGMLLEAPLNNIFESKFVDFKRAWDHNWSGESAKKVSIFRNVSIKVHHFFNI